MVEYASNSDPDSYASVEDGPEIELKVKGSRFLGQVFDVGDEVAADLALQGVRRRYHDATHHCRAWRIGDPEMARERHEDDGEPSGTAGPPILNAIHGAGVTDVLVVVTRYYGGTKLGTGGLARAYGDAAREALAAAPRRTVWREAVLRVDFDFDDLGPVETLIGKSSEALRHVEREFDPRPRLVLTVKQSRAEALGAALIEVTAGRARVERL